MSRIRSRGNKDTELALARVFRAEGITGWRRQIAIPLGRSRGDETQTDRKPMRTGLIRASSRRLLRVRADFVFPKLRLAVFVDGCFWHACPRHATRPKGNAAFWRKKLAANQARDRRVNRELKRAGWRVVRIWEHELRAPNRVLARVRRALGNHPRTQRDTKGGPSGTRPPRR